MCEEAGSFESWKNGMSPEMEQAFPRFVPLVVVQWSRARQLGKMTQQIPSSLLQPCRVPQRLLFVPNSISTISRRVHQGDVFRRCPAGVKIQSVEFLPEKKKMFVIECLQCTMSTRSPADIRCFNECGKIFERRPRVKDDD
jgi:hypothetical protein